MNAARAPLIVLERVTYRYAAMSSTLFQDLDLEVRGAGSTALVGPSGCGKSTLLFLLGLFLRPERGRVRAGDIDAWSANDRFRSKMRGRHIGFIFQDACLDDRRSILENVLETQVYQGDADVTRRDRAVELLDRFGLDLPLDRRPTELSGGQLQRVALCRALLPGPSLVLADEPTGNLDGQNAALVVDALFDQVAHGASIVLATHDRSLAARCDRVIELVAHE